VASLSQSVIGAHRLNRKRSPGINLVPEDGKNRASTNNRNWLLLLLEKSGFRTLNSAAIIAELPF
jgi:hypothetical protein